MYHINQRLLFIYFNLFITEGTTPSLFDVLLLTDGSDLLLTNGGSLLLSGS